MHITTPIVLGGPAAARPRGSPASPRRALVLAGAAAAAGAALVLSQQRHPSSSRSLRTARSKPRISWLAVDALSGAIGEVASLVVLYPLDSLKVLCQARGSSTGAVLAELRALGCSGRALRQLYAGCGSAALCSAAIGAVYLLAFYSAKRLVAAAATTVAAAKQQQQQQQLVVAAGQPHERQRPAAKAGSGSQLADSSTAHPPLNSEGTHPLVASVAGVIASLAGSVFEAPMEMFKLRTQAGALDGPMLRTMAREASTRGLGALYATYGAFMLKSIPFDVAELATYSQMTDWREAAAARTAAGGGDSSGGSDTWRGRVGEALAAMPLSASDMLIGAAAGVASVLVSMPCDVIKTRMDLHPPHCPAGGTTGALCSTKAFFETGRQLVAAGGGPHALFVGVAPRLLQTVPSTMVYWMAVEGTRRLMATHFEVDGAPADSADAPRPAAVTAAAAAPASLAMPAPALA